MFTRPRAAPEANGTGQDRVGDGAGHMPRIRDPDAPRRAHGTGARNGLTRCAHANRSRDPLPHRPAYQSSDTSQARSPAQHASIWATGTRSSSAWASSGSPGP